MNHNFRRHKMFTWTDLDKANKADGHYDRRNTCPDMVRYYHAKGMSEEAYRLRDEAQERMEASGIEFEHATLWEMEEEAERWKKRADHYYALANGECDCKPDASEVCRACKATLDEQYAGEIPYEEV